MGLFSSKGYAFTPNVFTWAYWFIAVYPQGAHACNIQPEIAT